MVFENAVRTNTTPTTFVPVLNQNSSENYYRLTAWTSYNKGYFYNEYDKRLYKDELNGFLYSNNAIVAENSSAADSSRKVNLNYDGSGYFCFSVWVKLDNLEEKQTIFEKSKEYALRYDPEKGFVVDLWVPDTSSDSIKYAWVSGTSDIKAGEWVYVAFSRHMTSQSNFYVNDRKIETEPEQIAWTGVRELADFKVGGFTGMIDELMLGSCYRDDHGDGAASHLCRC